jgi:hypothetical protein
MAASDVLSDERRELAGLLGMLSQNAPRPGFNALAQNASEDAIVRTRAVSQEDSTPLAAAVT